MSDHRVCDSLENDEGIPSRVLSLRGLPRRKLEFIVKAADIGLAKDEAVALAPVNVQNDHGSRPPDEIASCQNLKSL